MGGGQGGVEEDDPKRDTCAFYILLVLLYYFPVIMHAHMCVYTSVGPNKVAENISMVYFWKFRRIQNA